MEMPSKMEDQIARYEQMRGQLQMIMEQKYHMSNQMKEMERALEELADVDEETPVYRSVGSLLIKAPSPKELEAKLTEEKETIEVRLKSMEKQEQQLTEKVKDLEQELQSAMQGM